MFGLWCVNYVCLIAVWLVVACTQHTWNAPRFIKNNLLVELATEPAAVHTPLFNWVLRRHNLISYMMYMMGARLRGGLGRIA